MRNTLRLSFLPTALLTLLGLHAQAPAWQEPPRIVVGIVVDQMRTDYIYRFWDNFGEGGFKRLVREGSFQRDAHYDYVPTYTGPGHASIWTGTTPARHGIVSNDRYDRHTRGSVYCATDTTVRAVGTASTAGQRSPAQLLATTLFDELELRTDGKARTVAVSLKDRSAIMPAGRMGDAAYWFVGGEEGRFVTSSWYRDSLPAWLEAFNAQRLPEKYLSGTWDLLLPRERYHTPLPDDNIYEVPLERDVRPTLPLDLGALRRNGASLGLLNYTPWGNTIITDLALAAMAGENMGSDAVTDMLSVSYSSTDILGHKVGPRALELEDMYIRLDKELERLFKALDVRAGKGRYTVFLTADHAAADVPAYLRDQGGSAGYVQIAPIRELVQEALKGSGVQLEMLVDGQVFLSGKAADVRAAALDVAQALRHHALIAAAYSAEEALRAPAEDLSARAIRRGYMPQRSGDVIYLFRPGYFESYRNLEAGTTHGSGWNYDTHVPVLFMGRGVLPGEVLRRTSITDVAPTVSAIVGMALPNAADGTVVPELLQKR